MSENQESETKPPNKDSKLLAIIYMNLHAISATGMVATYRIIGDQGFHPGDFNLLRNFLTLFIAIVWCLYLGHNPKT